MFPQMPLQMIIEDLHDTNSAEATIENILENRLFMVNWSIIKNKFTLN